MDAGLNMQILSWRTAKFSRAGRGAWFDERGFFAIILANNFQRAYVIGFINYVRCERVNFSVISR